MAQLCERFARLMRDELEMKSAELAKQLGYANRSMVDGVVGGKTFPDVLRLQKLSQLKTKTGARPNLDWLITGNGKPMLIAEANMEADGGLDNQASAEAILRNLMPEQIEAFVRLLRR